MDLPFQVVEQTPAQSSQQTTLWKVLQQDENGDSLGEDLLISAVVNPVENCSSHFNVLIYCISLIVMRTF